MTDQPDNFHEKMVKAQKCAAKQDWEGFKEVFVKEDNVDELLLAPFDLYGNTAIHVASRSGSAELLDELLELLPETHRREALKKQNHDGNTILHEALVFDKDLMSVDTIKRVDTIMKFGQKLLDGHQQLLELKNTTKETPVFRAAKYGNLDALKHIHANITPLQRARHFPPRKIRGRQLPILHYCLLMYKFEVAIWLVEKVDRNLSREKYKIVNGTESTDQKNELGFTCFHLLSKMPMAFASKDTLEMGMIEKLIYHMLPAEGYESELDDDGNNWFKSTADIESGPLDDENKKPHKSIFSSLNYAVWKHLAKAGFRGIKEIWDQKKKHKFAVYLAKLLVKNRDPQQYSYWEGEQALYIFPDFPPNVTEKKKEIELKRRVQKAEEIKQKMNKLKQEEEIDIEAIKNETSWETPLFLAAASGIIEVVQIIVDDYPDAISHINKDGLSILHVAIKHRQWEIYEFIEKSAAFKSLVRRICEKGRTILHQAASMEYYREQALPGVAYQLQDELEWYHRVRSSLPNRYIMHCDNDGLTARDLLDIEHAEMREQAKQWMKETVQACSTVAVLIVGVVFTAAYTIAGGTEEGPSRVDLASRIFTVMYVMALSCSLSSMMMFLSIHTFSFNLWDFHKSLPRMMRLGCVMLFCALIATISAFAATVWQTIRMAGNESTTTFIYSLAFVVVSLFGLIQFPLFKLFEDQVKRCLKLSKKNRVPVY